MTFYRKPRDNKGSLICFGQQPIGVNTLNSYMSKMCTAAGICVDDKSNSTENKACSRRITGHSGKVTLCTRLYEQNFDEQAIMHRSGHRSDAVRKYKRPSEELLASVSKALQPPRPLSAPPQCVPKAEQTSTRPSSAPPEHCPSQSSAANFPACDVNGTLMMTVPQSINRVIIMKNGKRYMLEL